MQWCLYLNACLKYLLSRFTSPRAETLRANREWITSSHHTLTRKSSVTQYSFIYTYLWVLFWNVSRCEQLSEEFVMKGLYSEVGVSQNVEDWRTLLKVNHWWLYKLIRSKKQCHKLAFILHHTRIQSWESALRPTASTVHTWWSWRCLLVNSATACVPSNKHHKKSTRFYSSLRIRSTIDPTIIC